MVSADVRGFVAIAKVLSIDVRRVPPKLDPDVPQYVPQFCLDPMESGARHVLLGHTHLPAHSSGGHSTATSLTVPVSTGRPLADVVGTSKTPFQRRAAWNTWAATLPALRRRRRNQRFDDRQQLVSD
jgi:hypothetical protein